MKKVFLMISLVLGIVFSGCSAGKSVQVSPAVTGGGDFEISEIGKDSYEVYNGKRIHNGFGNIESFQKFAKTFNVICKLGKSKGFKYFAVLNENVNNLNGFPMNTFKSYRRYLTLDSYKHYQPKVTIGKGSKTIISSTGHPNIRVQYFRQKIPGVFLWSIDETMQEIQPYI